MMQKTMTIIHTLVICNFGKRFAFSDMPDRTQSDMFN